MPVVEAWFEPCGLGAPLEIVSMDKAFARLANLGGCGPENECIPPGWQAIAGASGVTIMEDAGGRFLTHTNATQTTRIVGGGQRYEDVEVKFSYRFRSDTQPAQSIEVMPMYARDQDGVELFTSLQVSPSGLMLRNRSVIGYNDPCSDGYCPIYDLNEESASYGSVYGVWYEVLMRLYGDYVFVWVKPAGEALPWDAWTIYNEPVLVAEGFTAYNAAPKVFRVYFNTANWLNAGALQVKDLSIAAWHCPEEAPVLDNTPCGDVVISEIQSYNQSTYEYPENEFHPWIELWNRTGGNADISGWALTDDPVDPDKYVFPANTILTSEYSIVILPENSGHADFKGFTLDSDNGGFVALLCQGTANSYQPLFATLAISYPPMSYNESFAVMPGSESDKISDLSFSLASTASAGFASIWDWFSRMDFVLDAEKAPQTWIVESIDPMLTSTFLGDIIDIKHLHEMASYATDIFQTNNSMPPDNVINGIPITHVDVPCNIKISFATDPRQTIKEATYWPTLIQNGILDNENKVFNAFLYSRSQVILVTRLRTRDENGITKDFIGYTPGSVPRSRIFLALGNAELSIGTFAHEFMHYCGMNGHEENCNNDNTKSGQRTISDRDGRNYSQILERVTLSDCQCKRIRSGWAAQLPASRVVYVPGIPPLAAGTEHVKLFDFAGRLGRKSSGTNCNGELRHVKEDGTCKESGMELGYGGFWYNLDGNYTYSNDLSNITYILDGRMLGY